MEKRIASPELVNDPAARNLLDVLETISDEIDIVDAIFYYDFPIFRDESNQLYRSKILLVTRSHGLYIFSYTTDIERDTVNVLKADNELSQLDSILYGKFLRSKLLRKSKREILFKVTPVIYCLGVKTENIPDEIENQIIFGSDELAELIEENSQELLDDNEWSDLTALLEGTKALSRPNDRDTAVLEPNSKALALVEIENKIATFDLEQRQAAISIVEGPQRIRGIAGSGKTIVLAMRAAHIHLANPEAMILLTFWTKSLYEMLKQMVTRFYRQFNDQDPDWEKIHILHGWGGRSTPGVYFNACIDNGIRAQAFRDIIAVNNRTKFEQACFDLLSQMPFKAKYDYTLIDEGQDLPRSFYQLCFNITRGGPIDRNIIWAYDELQTIMDARPQDVVKTFGVNSEGAPLIDLDRASQELSRGLLSHDIVLKKSYRNPPQILMCAHALGLGLYSNQPVQILEDEQHWEDLGYEFKKGSCIPGEATEIYRPSEYSPINIAEYTDQEDIISYKIASDVDEEVCWVVSEIMDFMQQGLKPHDILVITLDDRNSKTYFSHIAEKLSEKDISINNLQNSTYSIPEFFIENHVSVSTVYKAKGNEAAVVLVVGIDALAFYLDDRRARNKIFTAFTRSRAWLRISGIGDGAKIIFDEIDLAIKNYPYFVFNYPDPEKIETLQRDLSEKSAKLREMQQMALDIGLTDHDLETLIDTLKQQKIKKQ